MVTIDPNKKKKKEQPRGASLGERDRLELATARAKGRDKLIVQEKDEDKTLSERTGQEVAAIQGQKQLEANKQIISESPEGKAQTAREEEAKALFEEKGFFDETLPEKQELDPTRDKGRKFGEGGLPSLGEDIPVLGVSRAAVKAVFKNLDVEDTLIQNPEGARELALQEIQKDVIREGFSAGEKLGTIIEGIPFVGGLVGKYASGLIEDPRGNLNVIIKEVDSERERASVLAEKAFTGKLGNPLIAVEQIEDIENNLARLEQRIKLLADASPQLRASADELNKIEEKILRSKERVFIAKQAAAGGVVAPATDSNIFLTLQALNTQTSR